MIFNLHSAELEVNYGSIGSRDRVRDELEDSTLGGCSCTHLNGNLSLSMRAETTTKFNKDTHDIARAGAVVLSKDHAQGRQRGKNSGKVHPVDSSEGILNAASWLSHLFYRQKRRVRDQP
jgi:hypothetical protein